MGLDQQKPNSVEQAKTAFQRNDRNRDGKLSRQEIPEAQRRCFDAADTDNDGSLSLEELSKTLKRRRGQ
jgi:Ca2+-binding EF-hand superfamily protein